MHIRPIETQDIATIEKIVASEWYQNFTAKDPISAAADVFFDVQSCLNNSCFGQVAVLDGQVVGVIMARADSEHLHLRALQSDPYDQLMTLLSRPKAIQDELVNDHQREKAINEGLLARSGVNYDGEITLFILAPSARGKGIGRTLFQSALSYFEKQKVQHYYLYTDDACTVSFYQKAGLRENGAHNIYPDGEAPFHYYLYDNLKP